MSAESSIVYFMKRVKDCKDVPIMISKMYSEDGQVITLFVYCNCLVLQSTIRMQSKHKQTKRSRRNTYRLQLSQ